MIDEANEEVDREDHFLIKLEEISYATIKLGRSVSDINGIPEMVDCISEMEKTTARLKTLKQQMVKHALDVYRLEDDVEDLEEGVDDAT